MKITKKIFANRTEWRNENDKLHRTNGPAVEQANGSKHWYRNGLLHRSDGPAIEIESGFEAWYFNGKFNRFVSEVALTKTLKNENLKSFILKNFFNLNENEIFLLHLTIKNNFPEHLDFLDKLLVLQ